MQHQNKHYTVSRVKISVSKIIHFCHQYKLVEWICQTDIIFGMCTSVYVQQNIIYWTTQLLCSFESFDIFGWV